MYTPYACSLSRLAVLVLLASPALLEAQTYNWTDRTPPPGIRENHAMAYDSARGVTVLFGGSYYDFSSYRSDTWEWNGTAGTWTQRSTTGPSARGDHAMVYDSARDVTVLFGGAYDDGTSHYYGDTWEWDGHTGTWTQRSNAGPSPRCGHAMAYDSTRGVTVLFGGTDGFSSYYGDTWEWNGTTGTWTQRSSTGPSPRYGHAMIYDSARGVTVLFGGRDSNGPKGDTWEWDGITGIWTQRSTTGPSARNSHAMVYDSAHGVTILFGGVGGFPQGDTWEWNGAAGTWTQRSSTGPSPRHGQAMAYDSARGRTVLFAGYSSFTMNGDTWEWNGTDGTWVQRWTTGPSARVRHTMAYDSARGVSVLFGGSDSTNSQGETWEWNGTAGTWTQRSSTGPSPRTNHAMVYDSARDVMVLFGGYGNTFQGDTWEWNGQTGTWTQRSNAGPSPRCGHAMAYDSARGVTVLFGGRFFDGTTYSYGDTWEWNGTAGTWTQHSSTGPPPRSYHAMAYDSSCGVSVLFGGSNSSGNYLGDTWEWNGTDGTWVQRSTTGPSVRTEHAMAYDSTRGVTVLFGGYGYGFQGNMWEWNGATATWTQRASSGPFPRSNHAMVYDTARGVTVLFGGQDGWGNPIGGIIRLLADTWEYRVLPAADFDRNGHVDAGDFQAFDLCLTGPGVPYDSQSLPPCPLTADGSGLIAADFDADNDVDQEDFGIFQRCYSGAASADPNCAN